MTSIEKVYELIQKVKKGVLKAEELKPEAALTEDLKLDSLALMELLVLTEEAFGLKISKDDAMAVKTVAQVVAYLESRGVA